MSLLERVIKAHRCRSTHHYIAIEATTLLGGPHAKTWRDLILVYHEELLVGAKAPDTTFRDFKNHVLHVGDKDWGGAPKAASDWYEKAVQSFADERWDDGVYALGVMSHYYADPVQPFHTGQTEEEGAMHRALEWSIAKSRPQIEARVAAKGYPHVEGGRDPGFVADMVRAGALRSHPHYDTFIDHYDLDIGVKDPPAGLDETLLELISDLVAYATAGLAHLYSRVFKAAEVKPPKMSLTLPGYLATLDIPVRQITKKLEDAADKRTVEAMYAEFKDTGKVIATLPDDDKAVRRMHAREVLRVPLEKLDARPIRPLGTKHGWVPGAPLPQSDAQTANTKPAVPSPAKSKNPPPLKPEKQAMTRASDVEAAPSIGPKTAARLNAVGIYTIADLIAADPDTTATKLAARHIRPKTIIEWQTQTQLMLDVPGLRVLDSQILVGAGIHTAEDLARASAKSVLQAATSFLQTPRGARVAWGDTSLPPDKVERWIDLAKTGPDASKDP